VNLLGGGENLGQIHPLTASPGRTSTRAIAPAGSAERMRSTRILGTHPVFFELTDAGAPSGSRFSE
jgi:hypothetical protein